MIHDDFKPANDTLYLSEEITLGAQVTPADATYDKVDWRTQSINNGLVYTYPTEGPNARRTIKVSGQHTGQVKFTAYAGGVSSAPYTITIKELEAEITNLPAGNKMTVGQTHQLGKIVGPSDAKVHWNVANDNIATIDQTGKITALAPGSTAVWIEVSKFEVIETATFTLTVVNPPVSNVTINNKTLHAVKSSTTINYTATVSPSNADNKAVIWSSSNESVAIIDKNSGHLTAVGAGTTIIKATSVSNSKKSDSFTLTVEPKYFSERDYEIMSTEDKALMSVLQLIYAKYAEIGDYKSRLRQDGIIQEMQRIRSKPEYKNKYSYCVDTLLPVYTLKTTKIQIVELKTITKEEIAFMHNRDSIIIALTSLIPTYGIFISPLMEALRQEEQKGEIDFWGISKDVIQDILLKDEQYLGYLLTAITTGEQLLSTEGKETYVDEYGYRLAAGDTIITLNVDYDLGRERHNFHFVVRNDVAIPVFDYGPTRFDKPIQGHSDSSWKSRMQEWEAEGYVAD